MSYRGPSAARWQWAVFLALAAIYLALTAVMVIDQDSTRDLVLEANPELSTSKVNSAVVMTVAGTALMHVVHLAVLAWLLSKTQAGRRWARIGLSVYLPVAIIASFLSWDLMPYAWAVITANLLQVLMIILLWAPRPEARHR